MMFMKEIEYKRGGEESTNAVIRGAIEECALQF